jgi:hypothetical protein
MESVDILTVEVESRDISTESNEDISQDLINRISKYYNSTPEAITKRLQELENEWDIEKTVQMNVSTMAIAGIILGTLFSKRWFLLSGIAAGIMFLNGIGAKQPSQFLKSVGVRTRQEIDDEIYGLKALRGDFENLTTAGPEDIIRRFRKSEA